MTNSLQSSENLVEKFSCDGYVFLPDFYDVENEIYPILEDIYKIIGIVAKKYNIIINRRPVSLDSFDDGYVDLIKINRRLGGEIYDAVKQIPAFIQLVSNQKNQRLFELLRPNSFPGIAAAGYGMRINNPFEEKYRANLHQEYPAQLRSLDGLVFWSPLVTVLNKLGPVNIYPGSHVEGAIPVHTEDLNNKDKQGAYSLVLHKEKEYLKKYKKVAPLSKPGDLIVMDFLLLHSSGLNTSERALWTMQFRYFNYLEKTGISHGWKGGFASGIDFRTIHPELCVGENNEN